jgi:hypothetical protein
MSVAFLANAELVPAPARLASELTEVFAVRVVLGTSYRRSPSHVPLYPNTRST